MYYYHCNHKVNSYKENNQKLDVKIKQIYEESKGRYGSPKITKNYKKKVLTLAKKELLEE